MKLVDQVCTLEQAQKLKELGVIQHSVWYWEKAKTGFVIYSPPRYVLFSPMIDGDNVLFTPKNDQYSAFTGSELRLLLPEYMEDANGDKYRLHEWLNELPLVRFDVDDDEYNGFNSRYDDIYRPKENRYPKILKGKRTEAIARANLLIHILEDHKFSCVRLAECNQRLIA